MQHRTGGKILIDALVINNVDTVFGVPGESYLEALDAIYERRDRIKFITCRQEGGAGFMAEAYANATGRLGVGFVTRGPGVTNASIGMHTAFQASTPMLLLIGQVPRHQIEREAFQEINYKEMLGPVTKWVAQVDDPARLPEFINRAINIAMNGRSGPVALALPEDMLVELAQTEDLPPAVLTRASPNIDDLAKVKELLSKAQRPLLVVGGSNWDEAGRSALHEFASCNQIPVATGFRRQDLFDNAHPCYVGNLGFASFDSLLDYVIKADLVIALGSRLGDGTVRKYTLIEAPNPKQTLVHILPAADELGRVLSPQLAICSDPNLFARMAKTEIVIDDPVWKKGTQTLAGQFRDALHLGPQAGPVDMGIIMDYLRNTLPSDAIVTNGAGNYSDWPNKMYTYRRPRTTLAPISGAMGYSVPSAVAAKIAFPDRVVVSFAGDGDFLMNGQELATAVQYDLNPIFLVINNSSYGTIRIHQETHHPDRISGTDLKNPDFAAMGRSFGAVGEIIEKTEEFIPAFERALKSDSATLLELRVGPDSFGPDTSLSGLKENMGRADG